MEYNILWIDDEWKIQKDFIGEAEQEGLNVFPFESHEEGMSDLKDKSDFYHAVVLDAKVKNNKKDTVPSLEGLRASRDRLIEINQEVYLPYFIFTGQPDYISNNLFKQSYGNYFIKGIDNDKLYDSIKVAIGKSSEEKARKEFGDVFKSFDSGILNNKAKQLFIEIVKCIAEQDFRKKNIMLQRDLLELIFKSLNNPIPCLPNSFFDTRLDNKPNQEWCVRFIEGRPTTDGDRIEHRIQHRVSKDIQLSFRKLKESVNKYSHDSVKSDVKLPFLSNTYLLMEILEWMPDYADDNYSNFI